MDAVLTGSMTTCDLASRSPKVMLRSGTAVDRSHRRCAVQNGVSRNTTLTGTPASKAIGLTHMPGCIAEAIVAQLCHQHDSVHMFMTHTHGSRLLSGRREARFEDSTCGHRAGQGNRQQLERLSQRRG